MSKKLLKIKQFTEKDLAEADGVKERIYIWMMSDKLTLSDRDMDYYDKLIKAFHIMSSSISGPSTTKKIHKALSFDGPLTVRQIHNIKKDAAYVFGDMIERNKALDRAVLVEKFNKLAEGSDDEFLKVECWKAIAKVTGADKQDYEAFDPKTLDLPSITITSNPKALNPDIEEAIIDDKG